MSMGNKRQGKSEKTLVIVAIVLTSVLETTDVILGGWARWREGVKKQQKTEEK